MQIKLPGAEPFRLCRELLDGVVMVDNGTIATALKVGGPGLKGKHCCGFVFDWGGCVTAASCWMVEVLLRPRSRWACGLEWAADLDNTTRCNGAIAFCLKDYGACLLRQLCQPGACFAVHLSGMQECCPTCRMCSTRRAPSWSLRHRYSSPLFCTFHNWQDVFNETRTILEPAGAVALAGAKAYLQVRCSGDLPGCTPPLRTAMWL